MEKGGGHGQSWTSTLDIFECQLLVYIHSIPDCDGQECV